MTYQEALKKEKLWTKRVAIIAIYHNQMCMKRKKWNMRATAKQLGISVGAVSEGLKLAIAILERPELEVMTREDALAELRK